MKYLKYYELEEGYHEEKDTYEFPTVSFTEDTDKVWYMKKNQVKMKFFISEDDVNNNNGEDILVWEGASIFDSVTVNGVEQKTPVQKKDIIITGDTRGEIVDITIENSVIQGTITQAQPVSVEEEIMPAMSEVYPYVINMTEANQLPEVDSITYKLTTTSINNLAYKPSIYIRYAYASVAPEISESQSFNYQLLDWWTAQDSFSMVVSDDGTEIQFTMPSEVKITHLFIIPKASIEEANVSAGESAVEGIYLDDNNFLYSYDTDNILLPCQFGSLKFMLDELSYMTSEYLNENVNIVSYMFDEPISLSSNLNGYSLYITQQIKDNDVWSNAFSQEIPLSEIASFLFMRDNKIEGINLSALFPVLSVENDIRLGLYVLNSKGLVNSYMHIVSGGVGPLYLPTTEADKEYDIVATKYGEVVDMTNMFSNINRIFLLDLENFDTSNVTNMAGMFYNCSGLFVPEYQIQGFNKLNTSKVITMPNMFGGCINLSSINVNHFDTSNVTDMSGMFAYCSGLTSLDLSSFDTSNVTDMSYMFASCFGLTSLDVSNFNTSNVTNMNSMFIGCSGLTSLNLSSFDTVNVNDMTNMFSGCGGLTTFKYFKKTKPQAQDLMSLGLSALTSVDFSGWDASNVTNMRYLCHKCSKLTSVTFSDTFDTSNVTNMSYMFSGCTRLASLDLSSFDISHLYTGGDDTMFKSCYNLKSFKYFKKTKSDAPRLGYLPQKSNMLGLSALTSVDFSSWDTSNVTSMNGLCSGCTSLTSVTFGENFDTSNVTNMGGMFSECSRLTSIDLSSFDTSNVTNMGGMFSRCSGLTSIDLSSFDTSNVTNMNSMFYYCPNLKSVKYFKKTASEPYALYKLSLNGVLSIDFSSWDTSNVTSMSGLCIECNSLTSVTFSDTFDTSNVTNMSYMFSGCTRLASLDLSNFNTSKVTNMNNMFTDCKGLTSLDLNSFNTSNVTNMASMFYGCSKLTSIDLSNFNTSNVTYMSYIFYGCRGLTSMTQVIGFESLDTSNVTNMNFMFSYCSGLISLDLSSFDTSKVTNMVQMFAGCSLLTSLDLSSFDTSKVTDMDSMFVGCLGLTSLDLSNFDTSNVTNMGGMFSNCRGLTSLDLSNFDTSNVTNMTQIFMYCSGLTSITFGSQADVSKVTNMSLMFSNITTTGTLTYPSAYADAWNNILVTNQSTSKFPSTWTKQVAVDYENGETAPMSE